MQQQMAFCASGLNKAQDEYILKRGLSKLISAHPETNYFFINKPSGMSRIQTQNPEAPGQIGSAAGSLLTPIITGADEQTHIFRVKGSVSLVPDSRVHRPPSPPPLIVTAHQTSSTNHCFKYPDRLAFTKLIHTNLFIQTYSLKLDEAV